VQQGELYGLRVAAAESDMATDVIELREAALDALCI